MNEIVEEQATQAAFRSGEPRRFSDLLHGANALTLRLTAVAVAVAWVPPAALCALRGGDAFLSFLTDYSFQSRLLLILPILILGGPDLTNRLCKVAHDLEDFVPENQMSRFQASWTWFQSLRDSKVAIVMIVLLAYLLAASLGQYVDQQGIEIISWWKGGGGGFRWFSPAASWTTFVSYPILVSLALLWLWRHLLWTWFMGSTGHLDLRLIAAHPDGVGGLAFLETSLRGQRPFSFCLGVALGGAVANRVLHGGQKLTDFVRVPVILVGAVLVVCVVPYFAFTPVLMRLRRRGLERYGAFARTAGEHFEKKWLNRADSLNQDVLMAADFSALHSLYAVVGNVNDIKAVPVSRVDLVAVIVVAFIPAIPVVLGSVPFQTVAEAALKLLF